VVHFCSHHALPERFLGGISCGSGSKNTTDHHNMADDTTDDTVMVVQLIQLAQAADFLQLPVLQQLAETQVRRRLAAQPALACLVLQHSAHGDLAAAARQMIECRPYVALEHVTVLAPEKLEWGVLQSAAIGCGEWFLFGQLRRWYQYQVERLEEDDNDNSEEDDGKSKPQPKEQLLLQTARQLCRRHMRLENIEPEHLLSPAVQSCPFVDREQIFAAVAQQALQASQDKVWRLPCRGARCSTNSGSSGLLLQQPSSLTSPQSRSYSNGADERILVEGAGRREVNGLYYRIAPGLANRSDLYSKREVACGQQYVYTLSRCLIRNNNNNANGQQQQGDGDGDDCHYEFRIFGSKFLTHRAVPSLVQMQSTATLVPCFQPVLQVLEVQPPADAATTMDPQQQQYHHHHSNSLDLSLIPAPIRKFYRVRLSDGDYCLNGTLADHHLNNNEGELREKYVIQVLEFGVYTAHGRVHIHVIKAVVITTTPAYVFGDPVPFDEDAEQEKNADSSSSSSSDHPTAMQNLYKCQCPVDEQQEHTRKIPRTGWQVDAHGAEPAPTCSWIPDRCESSRQQQQRPEYIQLQ